MSVTMTVVLSLAYLVALVSLASGLLKVMRDLNKAREQLVGERLRHAEEIKTERALRAKSEDQAYALVDKIYPLIEKTDWMSGRWGGMFDTLVRLENKRNANVDAARKALWSIPLVATYIRDLYKENNK